MQARFVGDPEDDFSGPSRVVVHGATFVKGEFIHVQQALAERLSGHSHFEVQASVRANRGKRKEAGNGDTHRPD